MAHETTRGAERETHTRTTRTHLHLFHHGTVELMERVFPLCAFLAVTPVIRSVGILMGGISGIAMPAI